MMISETIRHPFPPLYDSDSEILLLGTMPSPKSRERAFFYMHSSNRFWKVLAEIYGEKLSFKNSDGEKAVLERKTLIKKHKLALWDVLSECSIKGAADSSIKQAVPNDFRKILSSSKIKKILCTGKTSWELYEKLCYEKTKIHAVCLPSTSSANVSWNFEMLCEEYRRELCQNTVSQ